MAKRSQKSSRGWLSYERHHEQVAPRSVFVKRLLGSLAMALGLMVTVLLIGIAGYHYLAGFDLVDSLLEASMLLGGMGPVNPLPSDAAKIFASLYALFSGLIFIAVMGLVLTPVVHRILHKFHVDEKDVD
jgi:hypothetical protein